MLVNIERVRVVLSGFPGGPGVNTFHFTSAGPHLAALKTFYTSIAALVPTDVNMKIEGTGDTLDPLSGSIVGAWTGVAPGALNGISSGGYAAPVGAVVRWNTETVLNGRRLRGRTFLVPLGGASFQTDGTIQDGNVGTIQAAASAFVTACAGELVVHNRPQDATPTWTDVHGHVHAAKPSRAGGFSAVTSATAVDKSVVLRSRRD